MYCRPLQSKDDQSREKICKIHLQSGRNVHSVSDSDARIPLCSFHIARNCNRTNRKLREVLTEFLEGYQKVGMVPARREVDFLELGNLLRTNMVDVVHGDENRHVVLKNLRVPLSRRGFENCLCLLKKARRIDSADDLPMDLPRHALVEVGMLFPD